jgi:O-acetyl-ADP-ribose deacetylase (regulator of RNase III)
MEVILCDSNPEVVKAWHFFFDRGGRVTISEGDILNAEISALVLPINSFGIMDDGFAESINKKTDGLLESRTRKLLLEKYAGEMPVGQAEVVNSGLEKPGLVVLTPTVRVPQRMQNAPSVSAYLSTRAALRAVAAYVRNGGGGQKGALPLDSVGFVGMSTGQGGQSPATAAFQMYEAYCQVVLGQVPNFATLEAATAHDQELRKNRFL